MTDYLETIIAILQGKSNEANLEMQFVTFDEACLQGYADNLPEKQIEKIWQLFAKIQTLFTQRGIPTSWMLDNSIELFRSVANGDENEDEEIPGYRW